MPEVSYDNNKRIGVFLNHKKEHYPLSDEFMTNYGQEKDGYIAFAAKTGHPIDKLKCEPNQKWHFFESWLIQSFEDGTIKSWDNDACKKFYNSISCSELLLWFFEAVGLDSSEVEAAKEIAEDGKKRNCYSSTIAKEIRDRIPWEVIENTMKAQI
ncbi:MAG: hypothetical protein HDR72_02585 [Ruminococcaceae bacterium]|nr:hypothetical protein [Oscillospiraceae bacterium]